MDAAHCASASLGRRAIGQQVGTVVGAVIGSFIPVIGTQLGAVIGGLIGGYIDPMKVQGPRLSDGMTVTALDGIPNPWGFGTFSNAANVIWTADLEEHSHTDDGKGSGVEQETFTYTRSYALGICRAKREEDGTYSDIAGILRVTHNNKVVYNTQPDATPEQLANNSKFLENHKFYLGGETQEPDPTIESYLGAGNVSAYRGQVYMVATDEDQTELQGAIGTWEFVVAMDGELGDQGFGPLTLGPSNSMWADGAGALTDPRREGVEYEYQFSSDGNIDPDAWRSTLAAAISDYESEVGLEVLSPTLMGWSTTFYGDGYEINEPIAPWEDITSGSIDWTQRLILGLTFSRYSPDSTQTNIDVFSSGGLSSEYQCPVYNEMAWSAKLINSDGNQAGGNRIVISAAVAEHASDLSLGCFNGGSFDGDGLNVYSGFAIAVRAKLGCYGSAPAGSKPIPDAPGFWIEPDGTISGGTNCEPVSGTYKQLQVRTEDTFPWAIGTLPIGPTLASDDPDYDDQTFWEDAYADALADGLMEAGLIYGVDYPVVVDSACACDNRPLLVEGVLLSTIIAEVCRRCGLESTDIDVSELTDVVGGFKVAVETTGESIISSLMPAYFFDCGEWDDKLRFIKRGGDATFALTPEDMAERDGPVIEETESQEVELLRKVHVRAMDPAAGYVETTQSAERRSSTVAADGEQTLALPVVMDKDTQARVAEKRIKVAWAEPRRFKWTLPYTRPELTPTDVGTITDRSSRTQRVRLMEMTEDGGLIQIEEAMLDRQSAYTSDVEGVTHGPPTDTSPGLIGPTFGVPMNLPSLRTQDNVPGAYIAACGYLPGWRACAVLMSVDGGESFAQVMTISQPSRMGVLTADVTASGEPIEVFMNSGEISSITEAQLSARGNAWAITSDFASVDAVSEVGQSKTATQTSSGGYELTENVRGALGTTAASHLDGDPFVMLSSVYFLPLDISLSGQTLYFKFVSFGTSSDEAEEIPFRFIPIFTSVIVEPYTDDSGNTYTDDADNIYYYEAVT